MQLLKALSTLAVASTVVAAPAPAQELDERAVTNPDWWSVVGWGNPGCKGHVVWFKTGSVSGCHSSQFLAASYSWAVARETSIMSLPDPDFCPPADWGPKASRLTYNVVGSGSGRVEQDCKDVPIMSFDLRIGY